MLTTEDKARVFGMYLGSEIETPDGLATFHSIQRTGVHAHSDSRESRFYSFDEIKLSLFDLSDISDSDAIEVVRIIHDYGENYRVEGRSDGNTFVLYDVKTVSGTRIIDRVVQISPINLFMPVASLLKPQSIISGIDFLRSRHYALPYKGINLFDAGIAIRKRR